MSGNIQKHKQLTVVSDTALFREGSESYGFGPVVRELEFISPLFERIVWIGFDRPSESRRNLFDPITAANIDVIMLNACGGDKLIDKLIVLLRFPQMAYVIAKHLLPADIVHTRSPSTPAFIAVILSYLLRRKKWWNKYAGNWGDQDQPAFFGIQRNILRKADHTLVTINGFWKDQPAHCVSFENPCLTSTQIAAGLEIQSTKEFRAPFRLAFVGRLADAKGVGRIIEALENVDTELIERIDFIGDGPERVRHVEAARFLGDKAVFHGFLDTGRVHEILSESHFFLLPSKSEGFPKVVAEAACWGTIPIVSNVGSIPDYVSDGVNGFVWDQKGTTALAELLENALLERPENLKSISTRSVEIAKKFTFESFARKLEEEVLAEEKP